MKSSGEKQFFFNIWHSRPHICDLCGCHLGYEPLAYHFSHILGKGAYPRFRLKDENIMLNCFDCHRKWDAGDASALQGYSKMIKKREDLKELYYQS